MESINKNGMKSDQSNIDHQIKFQVNTRLNCV